MRFKRKNLMFIAGLAGMMVFSGLFSQEINRQTLSLRFFDSASGYAVQPEAVSIYDIEHQKTVLELFPADFQSPGKTALRLVQGAHSLTVQASGYKTMYARLNVGKNTPSQIRFFLDPQKLPEALDDAHISSQRRGDAMLVTGFITTDATGLPLEGVRIYSPEAAMESVSDARGYFRVYLPLNQPTGRLALEKAGFVSQERTGIELWPNGDWQYRIRLKEGEGEEVYDDGKSAENAAEECQDCNTENEEKNNEAGQSLPPGGSLEKIRLQDAPLPSTIRVGRNCPTKTTCSIVEVYSLQTYCKFVLPAEWYSCWGSLSGGANSLRAGAVAIRSYGVWHVYHPLTANYDICGTPSCQNFGDVQSGNGNQAVDFTERFVLLDPTNQVARSEYSAENNNQGCGDGFTGTGTSWPCIPDPVCAGQTPNGHGRGMCQWGSIRWANGTRVTTSSPCSEGIPHGEGVKTWEEILAHYYPFYPLVEGTAAEILSVSANPAAANPGQTVSFEYTIDAAPPIEALLGASIRPLAGGSWIDDPANDLIASLIDGVNNVSRPFLIPGNAAPGVYDILVTARYDSDGNGQISPGDFIFDQLQVNDALIVGVTTIAKIDHHIPAEFNLRQNYPNPFNPFTTIEFSLPQTAQAVLKIYDARGAEVITLVNNALSAGKYAVNWNAAKFASGVYFYRLMAEGSESFAETRRLVLTR